MNTSSVRDPVALYRQRINPYWMATLEQLELPFSHTRGDGLYLYDENGEAWLDLVAGFGATSLGHNNPAIAERIAQHVLGHHPSTHPWAANLPAALLAHRLAEHSPLPDARAIFSCSGAEAVDTALKLAMAHTGRTQFIAFTQAFHGLTMSTLPLNGYPAWASPLPPLPQHNCIVPAGSLDECRSCIETGKFAAVVLELVQGIGGGFVWPEAALGELAQACRKHGTLLIADEVQTGIGRTGGMYASERFPSGYRPDIIVLAKGLTGGALPLSATLCSPAVHHSLFGGPGCAKIHGSTYGGYAAGVAAAGAVLDYMEQHAILEHVRLTSAAFREQLAAIQRRYRVVDAIDGAGLLVTVTFVADAEDLSAFCLQQFFANRILINLAAHRPNTIKFTPPLTVTRAELDRAAQVLEHTLEAYTT